jgi:uncharacterized repeat protein (TIGR02543 family)
LNRVVYVKSLPYYPARKDAAPLESVERRDIAPFASGTPKGAGMLAKEKPVKKGGKIFMTFVGLILLAAAALASGAWAQSYFGKEEEKEEVYAVVFVVDGETHYETTVKKGGEVIFPEVEPTKDGYEFAGWAYEGGALFDGAEVNATLTLVAKWTAIESYTVSFVVEGLDEPYYEITLRKDEAVTFPEEPTKTGYDFVGWMYDGGTLFEGGSANGNLILTAKWTETTKLLGQLKAALKKLLTVEYERLIAANESYDQGSLDKWNEAYEGGIEAIEAANYADAVDGAYSNAIIEMNAVQVNFTAGLEYTSADGGWEVGYGDATDLEVVIPAVYQGQKVVRIAESGFQEQEYEEYIISVKIPNSVTSIGDWAFAYNSSLKIINIPDEVTSIGYMAFASCSSLTKISIPEGVTTIGDRAFEYCGSLITIVIPKGVTSIGYGMFSSCTNLATITLPEGLTRIGDMAFSYCDSLTTVTIPEGVMVIGDWEEVFRHCTSLTGINVDTNNEAYMSVDGVLYNKEQTALICYPAGKTVSSFTIPAGVTTIKEWAFGFCSSLTTIVIPEGVTSIGNAAFASCSSLTTIVIPEGVITMGYGAFQGCTELTIYVETEMTPNGWASSWNIAGRPVYLYSKEYKSGWYWHYETIDGVKVPTPWN